ncbi:hypothetical protein [Streptomyces sp. NPDC004284]|uniref:hypothetical protein n=1 Tax=Streptomyces sp. NPDC004284 TaxID=3364695 RepID=UPI0036ADB035
MRRREGALSTGEISFREESGQWVVEEVNNQSTGYRPDVISWLAVVDALERIGMRHLSGFAHKVVFRCRRPCRSKTSS